MIVTPRVMLNRSTAIAGCAAALVILSLAAFAARGTVIRIRIVGSPYNDEMPKVPRALRLQEESGRLEYFLLSFLHQVQPPRELPAVHLATKHTDVRPIIVIAGRAPRPIVRVAVAEMLRTTIAVRPSTSTETSTTVSSTSCLHRAGTRRVGRCTRSARSSGTRT